MSSVNLDLAFAFVSRVVTEASVFAVGTRQKLPYLSWPRKGLLLVSYTSVQQNRINFDVVKVIHRLRGNKMDRTDPGRCNYFPKSSQRSWNYITYTITLLRKSIYVSLLVRRTFERESQAPT